MKTSIKALILISLLTLFFSSPNLTLLAAGETVTLENPLGNITNPTQLYARLIFAFMGMTGVVALIMFLIGGWQWLTAGGNAEKVKKGEETIIWAVFGLVLIFASYAILRAVFETLKF